MKDHSKNKLIVCLSAAVAGLALFFVGYAVGVGKAANIFLDAGIKYLKVNNITIIGADFVMDKHRALSYLLQFLKGGVG
jgi:hypothetical protein